VRWAESLVRFIDSVNLKVGKAVSWLSFSLLLLVVFDVVMRYVFKKSFVAVQEADWHIFAVFFLIGGGYTLFRDSHVRVDIFYQKMSARLQAWINLLGVLLFLLPGCYLVIKTSSKFAWTSWLIREASADPGGLPGRYLLKAVVAVAFVLIAFQGISMGLKSLMTLLGRPMPEIQRKGGH